MNKIFDQFEALYKVVAELIQRNDETGARVNAAVNNHGVDLGWCCSVVLQQDDTYNKIKDLKRWKPKDIRQGPRTQQA